MKWITLGTLVVALAFTVGFTVGSGHEKNEITKQVNKQLLELQKKNTELSRLSGENYAKYKEAVNRKPTVITDRVYVKAKCPSEDPSGSLGDGTNEYRAELHSEVVRRITKVTDEAERDVLKCQSILNSLQEKISEFNK